MSVNFNLTTTDGFEAKVRNICFGLIQDFPISRYDVAERSRYPVSPGDCQAITSSNLKNVSFVPGTNEMSSIKSAIDDRPYVFLHRCMKDLPMFDGMTTVMPRNRKMVVDAKNLPADQVLLSLLIGRAFTYAARSYNNNIPMGELLKKGYSPRVALLGSMFIKNSGFGGIHYCLDNMQEESIFNAATFGYDALIKYLRQNASYNPWHQESIEEQEGYRRDDDFDYEDSFDDSGCGRCLVDCFSLTPEDVHFTDRVEKSSRLGAFDYSKPSWTEEEFFAMFDLFEQLRRGT